VRWLGYGLAAAGGAGLIAGSLTGRLPMGITEVLGFLTGAAAVWLVVRENVWNWPVGIANSAFFVVLFFQARLFADAGLNVLYVVLGCLGWYWWLRGGENRTALRVGRVSARHAGVLAGLGVVATAGMTILLERVGDAAPFPDALTTVLSLIAQYMLTRKLLENWAVWITADVIYIGLYLSRDLYLTALLYAVFLGMCVAGLVRWRRTWRAREAAPHPALAEVANA
jgi:nicotinamide mononucleotide transporter